MTINRVPLVGLDPNIELAEARKTVSALKKHAAGVQEEVQSIRGVADAFFSQLPQGTKAPEGFSRRKALRHIEAMQACLAALERTIQFGRKYLGDLKKGAGVTGGL